MRENEENILMGEETAEIRGEGDSVIPGGNQPGPACRESPKNEGKKDLGVWWAGEGEENITQHVPVEVSRQGNTSNPKKWN